MGIFTAYKPASHVRAGEWVYGPLTYVSLVHKVLKVEHLEQEFKTRLHLSNTHTSTLWNTSCIKVRRWWVRWFWWGRG